MNNTVMYQQPTVVPNPALSAAIVQQALQNQATPPPNPVPQSSFQFDLSMFEGDYTVKNSVVRVSNSIAQFLDETGDCLTVREGRLSVVFINKKCSVMLTLAQNPELRFYWTGMGDDYIEWTHCGDMNNAIRWTRIPKQYSMMPQMIATPTPPAAASFRYALPNEIMGAVPVMVNLPESYTPPVNVPVAQMMQV